jgi:hypothetical protein
MAYPTSMKPLTSFGTDWKAASTSLPNNPYASSDMGADTFRSEDEKPVVWLPPVDYVGLEDSPEKVLAAELGGAPFGRSGPLVGLGLAFAMAAGGFILIKGLSE